jgi:adenylate cyclase
MEQNKPTILYIDDEYYNLTTFVATFRHFYQIYTSTSAREAIDILKKHDISLIITDQRMPDMSGIEFFETIIPEYPQPVRMILTGFSDVDAIRQAINSGTVLRYITKPWEEKELKQIIDMGILIHELEKNERLFIKNLEQELIAQRKAIGMLKQYVPQPILKEMTELDLNTTNNQGELRSVTALVANFKPFMKVISAFDSKQLLMYLNTYLNIMIQSITKYHGHVYQIVGDELIALFDSDKQSSQLNAVQCSLEMINKLSEFKERTGLAIDSENVMDIGISSGQVFTGHLLTGYFLNDIAIGDPITQGFNLVALSQETPNTILIDEMTRSALPNSIITQPLSIKDQSIYKVIGKNEG